MIPGHFFYKQFEPVFFLFPTRKYLDWSFTFSFAVHITTMVMVKHEKTEEPLSL